MSILGAILVLVSLLGIYAFLLKGGKLKEREGAARTMDLGAFAFAGIAAKLASLTMVVAPFDSLSRWLLIGTVIALVHVFAPRKVEAAAIGVLMLVLFGRLIGGGLGFAYTPGLILWMVVVVGAYIVAFFALRAGPTALLLPSGVDGILPSFGAAIVGLGALIALGLDFFDPIWRAGIERMFETRFWTLFFFAAGFAFVVMLTAAPTFTAAVLAAGLVASEIVLRGIVLAIPGAATEAESAASVAVLILASWFLLIRMLGGRILGPLLPEGNS